MKKIKLNIGNNYIAGGKKYEKGKNYAVSDSVGNYLLSVKDTRDLSYFVLAVEAEEVDFSEEGTDADTGVGEEDAGEGDAEEAGEEAGEDLVDPEGDDAEVDAPDAPEKPVVDAKKTTRKTGKKEKTVQV